MLAETISNCSFGKASVSWPHLLPVNDTTGQAAARSSLRLPCSSGEGKVAGLAICPLSLAPLEKLPNPNVQALPAETVDSSSPTAVLLFFCNSTWSSNKE